MTSSGTICLVLTVLPGCEGAMAWLDRAAPEAPAAVTASADSSDKIDLHWSASTDDVGVEGYLVHRDGTQVADVFGTSYSDTGLSASTSYTYTVVAYDGAGNVSDPSAQVSATTPTEPAVGRSITTDPANPRWIYYQDGGPFFLAASGGPEGFLYRGTRQRDGTRTGGDQQAIIDALSAAGINGLYLMAVRSHGGDGGPSENPWIGSDPANGLDGNILNQWEAWFDSLDSAGITIFFIIYDDSADPFGGTTMGAEEESFVGALVDRFKHHDHLIWVVAEEYSERLPQNRASEIAAEIRSHDPVHPVAIHQLNSTTFDFPDDGNFGQFAMQVHSADIATLHSDGLTAWSNAAGRYNVNMSEWGVGHSDNSHGEQATDVIRQGNWAAAMAGGYVMVYGWWETNHSRDPTTTELSQLGYLASFMVGTRFDLMEPDDSRAAGDTEWVLAHRSDLGNDYFIGYGRNVSTGIGFTDLDQATYDLTWLDTESGDTVTERQTLSSSGTYSFQRPAALQGSELVVYLRPAADPA